MKNKFLGLKVFLMTLFAVISSACGTVNGEENSSGPSNSGTEEIEKYATVTFDANGGHFNSNETTVKETVIAGNYISAPISPIYDGNFFLGWYTSKTESTKWNFESSIVINDLTLYAHWEKDNLVTVKFDANGGKFSDGSVTQTTRIESGSKLTLPTNPEYIGWEFLGWKANYSDSFWNAENDLVFSDLTLYAQWEDKRAVVYQFENGTISDNEIFILVDHNTEYLSISNKVVVSQGASWKLYYDRLGQVEIPTKICASLSGSLVDGDNYFYILITSYDQTQISVYTLNLHRSFAIFFNFYDDDRIMKT